MPKRANPADLRQPTLGSPDVVGQLEKLVLVILADECAGVCSNVLDAVLGKPALNLRERVAMLLGMLILVADPRLAPRRLVLPPGSVPELHRPAGLVPPAIRRLARGLVPPRCVG